MGLSSSAAATVQTAFLPGNERPSAAKVDERRSASLIRDHQEVPMPDRDRLRTVDA
jgi:hypothetical protein